MSLIRERVIGPVDRRVGGCPLCDGRTWRLYDNLVTPPVTDPKSMEPLHGRVHPMVMVNCRGCGYSLFFDASFVGLEVT